MPPDLPQPSRQTGDPVRRLNGLLEVALQMVGGFDEMAAAPGPPIHALGGFGQEHRALSMLVENQDEHSRRIAPRHILGGMQGMEGAGS